MKRNDSCILLSNFDMHFATVGAFGVLFFIGCITTIQTSFVTKQAASHFKIVIFFLLIFLLEYNGFFIQKRLLSILINFK